MGVARFCAKCGTENTGGLDACPNCGSSLQLGAAQSAPPPMPPPSMMPYSPPVPLWGPPPPTVKRATVGTILGDTLSTFGKDFVVYFGIFLIYGAAITLSTLLATALVFGNPSGSVEVPTAGGPLVFDALYLYLALLVVIAVVGLVIQSILTATLTVFAVHRHQGTAITIGEAFRRGLPKFISILGASLLPGLLIGVSLAAILGLLLYGALTLNLGLMCGAGVLLLAMIPVTIYVTIALSLYAPPIMMEGKSALGGLSRSWELTRGRRLTLFGVFIVLGLLAFAISLAATIPFVFVANPYLSSIGQIVATAITGSWTAIMAAVAYNLIMSSQFPPPVGYGTAPPLWRPRS